MALEAEVALRAEGDLNVCASGRHFCQTGAAGFLQRAKVHPVDIYNVQSSIPNGEKSLNLSFTIHAMMMCLRATFYDK